MNAGRNSHGILLMNVVWLIVLNQTLGIFLRQSNRESD